MKVIAYRAHIVVGLTLVAIAAAVLGVAGYVVAKHDWAEARLADLEPRYARLAGLAQSGQLLGDELSSARAQLGRLAFPPEQTDSQVGSAAQQHARALAEAAGFAVSSIQGLAAQKQDGYELIPVSMRLEGDLPALHSLLASLAERAPLLLLESLSVQAGARSVGQEPRLNIQLTLSAVRLQ